MTRKMMASNKPPPLCPESENAEQKPSSSLDVVNVQKVENGTWEVVTPSTDWRMHRNETVVFMVYTRVDGNYNVSVDSDLELSNIHYTKHLNGTGYEYIIIKMCPQEIGVSDSSIRLIPVASSGKELSFNVTLQTIEKPLSEPVSILIAPPDDL